MYILFICVRIYVYVYASKKCVSGAGGSSLLSSSREPHSLFYLIQTIEDDLLSSKISKSLWMCKPVVFCYAETSVHHKSYVMHKP